MQLEDILRTAIEQGASDIHLISGHPPMMRVNTVITPMDYPILTPESVQEAMELMAQLRPLLLARLPLELLAVVQALLTAVLLLLLFLTSQSLGALQVLQALKAQLDQMLLSRWGQLLSVQAVLQQEPSVTTPQKTGLRA